MRGARRLTRRYRFHHHKTIGSERHLPLGGLGEAGCNVEPLYVGTGHDVQAVRAPRLRFPFDLMQQREPNAFAPFGGLDEDALEFGIVSLARRVVAFARDDRRKPQNARSSRD